MHGMQGAAMHEGAEFWVSVCPAWNEPVNATVVIPAYCAAATLRRALRSALYQTMPGVEVIVVDDASTDASWELIGGLLGEEPRLRAIRNKRNCGKPVSMNHAIKFARGRWLAVLDADDWYHPNRLATLVGIAEACNADLVADNQYFYDSAADKLVGTAWQVGNTGWELTFDGFLTGSNAYGTFNLGMLKPVLRMDFLRRASLDYEVRARHGQDFFYLLEFFLSGGRAVVADTPYYYYTQPFGVISRRWSHAARRRYDFQTAYDINQRYLAVADGSLTPLQAARLRKRNSRLKSLEYYYQAKERLAGGDMIGALARAARRPAMLGYVVRRIGSRLLGHGASRAIVRIAQRSRPISQLSGTALPTRPS